MALKRDQSLTRQDYTNIASILVEAIYRSDSKVAHEWGITPRTIRNYRAMLKENETVSQLFLEKKQQAEQEWASRINGAILKGIEFLGEAARSADINDTGKINAVTEAVRMLSEVALTKDLIDAKIGRYNLPYRAED